MFTSSYEEKAAAMEFVLTWKSTNVNHSSITILFCTNRKSLCEAIISSNLCTSLIHNVINSILPSKFIQGITGYSAIPDNALANKAAKEATFIAPNNIIPVSFTNSLHVTNEMIRDNPPTQKSVA